jgi:threonine synthase
VSERELAGAVSRLAVSGIRVEASGAAALAALRQIEPLPGPIVLLVTGRNIDDAMHRRAVERPESFPA